MKINLLCLADKTQKKKEVRYKKYNIILLAIVILTLYWGGESAIHAFIFHEGGFFDQIFHPAANEWWMRLHVITLLGILGSVAHFMIARCRKAEGTLLKYQSHLEEVVKERTAEITAAYEHLQQEVRIRDQINEALRDSERKFMEVAENIHEVFWLRTREEMIYISPAYEEIWGRSCGSLYQDPNSFIESIHPDDRDRISSALMCEQEHGMLFNEEYRIIKPDGEMRWIHARSFRVRKEGGRLRTVGIAEDITWRKEAEEALRKSEEQYRTLVENSHAMILVVDREGNFLFTNKACETVLGYSRKGLSRINGFALMHPDDEQIIRERLKKVFDEGKTQSSVEYRLRTKEGSYINILTNGAPLFNAEGKVTAALGICRDITERKEMEEALRESEVKYSTVVEKAKDGIIIIQDERYIFANQRAADDMEYPVEELIGKSVWVTLPPESRELAQSIMSGKNLPPVYEIKIKCGDGRIKDIESSSTIIDYQGKPAMLTVGRDVTERKRMEKALLQAEKKYHVLVDNASDAILVVDTQGNLLDANKKAEELLGYEKEELLRMNITQIHPKGEIENILSTFHYTIAKGSGCLSDSFVLRKDGRMVPIYINAGVIEYGGEKIIVGIIRDMTERKKLEEETLKMQKLESLGILAGGIAHDFNNLLAAIIGNLSLVEASLLGKGAMAEEVKSAKAASWQARGLTQQLLTFAQGGNPIKHPASIAELLTNTVNFSLSGSIVKGEVFLPDDLWWAEIDEGQITQVVNNMIINASQAMPHGGTIRIAAENILMETDGGLDLPLKRGRYVGVSIQDQGVGIPKEYLHKIFDPYFTTRQEGTGLGLAICYSIIKKHNGHIRVES